MKTNLFQSLFLIISVSLLLWNCSPSHDKGSDSQFDPQEKSRCDKALDVALKDCKEMNEARAKKCEFIARWNHLKCLATRYTDLNEDIEKIDLLKDSL